MLEKLFSVGLYGKLYNLINDCRKHGYSCGMQIDCVLTERPGNKYGFSASVITNNPSYGDVNGTYHFYQSNNYKTFKEAFASLTEEVAYASKKIPGVIFFRTFYLSSDEDVEIYLFQYQHLPNRQEWLESAVNCDWRKKAYGVREQFKNGIWMPHVTQEVEQYNLLEDSIDINDA